MIHPKAPEPTHFGTVIRSAPGTSRFHGTRTFLSQTKRPLKPSNTQNVAGSRDCIRRRSCRRSEVTCSSNSLLWRRGIMRTRVEFVGIPFDVHPRCRFSRLPLRTYSLLVQHHIFSLFTLAGPPEEIGNMLSTCLDLVLLCHPVVALLTMSRPTMKIQNPRIQFFVLSFLFLFALRSANALSGDRLKATPAPLNEVSAGTCQSRSQPNPIATTYPNNATGTLNGTVAVIPISLDLARSMIPTQYRILEHAYRSLLPSFPEGMYPVVLQAVHDHDVQAFGYEIPDFSVSQFDTTSRPALTAYSARAWSSPSSTC